ncbi:DNA repair helicase [Phlyctema vagabunda]|uniref:ATP-dependent DNA helicase CHL1 n=1 Tax=Phlyctema vagabunda TaxID=108571 RepID=A0ABR4PS03_9HELO
MPDTIATEPAQENHVTETAKDFHHPYTPYAIQETFMHTVYQVLQDGKGKSLSLICGSLTWLRDHKREKFEQGLNWDQDASGEPDWIIEQSRARKKRELLRYREDIEARLAKVRAKEKSQRDKYLKGETIHKKRRLDTSQKLGPPDDEEQFVLEDYNSDEEHMADPSSGLSSATLKLMEKVGLSIGASKEDDLEAEDEIKVFYCSRTHSQLTQFINELRRVNFPSSFPPDDSSDVPDTEDLKHLTLGSRKNLCINPSVNRLTSVSAINEKCLDLQQSSTAQENKCAFLPNKENEPLVNSFRDHTLATLRDIEDMGSLGKEIAICPYYASRAAVKPAEIVTLPYPLLLQKSAREALGLSLKGHVVIIDEAHNLMDAIAGIHSVDVSLKQLKKARGHLGGYLQKFRNRLKGQNRVYVAQIVRVIDSLSGYLQGRLTEPKADGIVNEKELLSGKGVDQINLFKLIKYLQESKLARKVESYTIYAATDALPSGSKPQSTTPVLHHISSLLSALTHPTSEGRLFFSKSTAEPEDISLKFQLLDPSTSFQEIVSEARAVILAGGTMSPMADYTSHLFPYLPISQITTLSCGHVIPRSNLMAWNLGKGPGGTDFEFNFKRRGDVQMIDELGRAILNMCTIVPDGVVVFFPSYSYLETIITRWSIEQSPSQPSIWTRLSTKKALFRESKEESVDRVLSEYAKAIDSGRGGLLFSVVGGKMSEGINFSDRLGRAVVIVGLPFPNAQSAEWKAKIEYIEASTTTRLSDAGGLSKGDIEKRAKDAGREYYENACMRAVNQSVGRAIRHREDYAAIVMVDRRFGNERIKSKLPGWIREGLVADAGEKNFGVLMGSLGTFFRGKRGA